MWGWLTGQDKAREIERSKGEAKTAEKQRDAAQQRAQELETTFDRMTELQKQMQTAKEREREAHDTNLRRLQDDMKEQNERDRNDWKESYDRMLERNEANQKRHEEDKQKKKVERERIQQNHENEIQRTREEAARSKERARKLNQEEREAMRRDMTEDRKRMDDKEKRLLEKTAEDKTEMRKVHDKHMEQTESRQDKERQITKDLSERHLKDLKEDAERLEKRHEKEKETMSEHLKLTKDTSDKTLKETTELLTKERERVENTLNSQIQSVKEDSERERKEHYEEKDQLKRDNNKAIRTQAEEHRRESDKTEAFHRKIFQDQQTAHREDKDRTAQDHRYSVDRILADREHERKYEERRQQRDDARFERLDEKLQNMIGFQQRTLELIFNNMSANSQTAALGPGPDASYMPLRAPPVYNEMYYGAPQREQQQIVPWNRYYQGSDHFQCPQSGSPWNSCDEHFIGRNAQAQRNTPHPMSERRQQEGNSVHLGHRAEDPGMSGPKEQGYDDTGRPMNTPGPRDDSNYDGKRFSKFDQEQGRRGHRSSDATNKGDCDGHGFRDSSGYQRESMSTLRVNQDDYERHYKDSRERDFDKSRDEQENDYRGSSARILSDPIRPPAASTANYYHEDTRKAGDRAWQGFEKPTTSDKDDNDDYDEGPRGRDFSDATRPPASCRGDYVKEDMRKAGDRAWQGSEKPTTSDKGDNDDYYEGPRGRDFSDVTRPPASCRGDYDKKDSRRAGNSAFQGSEKPTASDVDDKDDYGGSRGRNISDQTHPPASVTIYHDEEYTGRPRIQDNQDFVRSPASFHDCRK